ncbi:MAG: ABC transporter ATP-binding protein [Ruminococcus sp.]|nr:ABC transporter ATP-binding protein [Ruminococcus sp.]
MKSLSFLKNYKKQAISAPLFKLLEASFELFIPLVVADMIDKGINNGDSGYIISRVLILVLLAAVGLGFSITAQFFSARAAIGMATKLRSAVFKKIQSLSFSQLDSIGSATLITRMTSDINQIQTGVNMFLRLFLRSPFIVLGATLMAFYVDVKGALVFAVAVPVLSLIVFAVMFATIPMFRKVQSRLDSVLLKTKENVKGTRVIRAFTQEENEVKSFSSENQLLTKLQKSAGKVSAIMNPATFIVINLGIALLIYVGALRVDSGIITQGAVVALYNYMSQILVELIKLANLIITETKAIACKNRVDSILLLEEHKKPKGKDIKSEDFITFNNVSLSYGNNNEYSVKNISFSVKRGETVGIIGVTGSGKTSVVNLLCGFYEPTEGEIIVNNKNILNYTDRELDKTFSIVMQKAAMFRGTIRENILFGAVEKSDEEVRLAVENSQSAEIISNKARGLDEFVIEQGKNLSGGQKQRLSIARALVRNTPVLILDDSFSALDYKTDKALRKSLAEQSGRTTFIISQRTSTLENCDKIIVLDDGKVAGIGTNSELLSSCDEYKEIYTACNREVS